MMKCSYLEGEILFKVGRLAEELQKGVVDKPGWSAWLKEKTGELKEAINQAKPYLLNMEEARIDSAMSELTKLHTLAHSNREAAAEEIIRTVQLPMTIAALRCLEEKR